MAFEKLLPNEQNIVLQCMTAILEGSFIDSFELQTRLGVDKEELKSVVAAYPQLDDTDEDSATNLAINNCMNEVCHGVDITPDKWIKWFNVSRENVKEVYIKWAKLKGYSSTGIM